ncbi:MAG: GrpB family protein [Verrucomicrobia bacterium]|nr:GrpB family protein [Verrucomicrobiota bacterium]
MSKTPQGEAPIEVVAYDPRWPSKFEMERVLLQSVLAPWLAGPIEHVGSTAIPGMPAKPVIDIIAAVENLETSRPAIDALAELGYVYFPYRPDIMHWFCKPSAAFRTHHLHLVPRGSKRWVERLAFRDAIRNDQSLAAEYAALESRLAQEFKFDREAYTDGKTPFVERVLRSRGSGASSANRKSQIHERPQIRLPPIAEEPRLHRRGRAQTGVVARAEVIAPEERGGLDHPPGPRQSRRPRRAD